MKTGSITILPTTDKGESQALLQTRPHERKLLEVERCAVASLSCSLNSVQGGYIGDYFRV